MRSLEELRCRLRAYGAAQYVYDPDVGYLAWHYSTGENLEALFLEVARKGEGLGRELYRRMVAQVNPIGQQPYHSVFAFRLASNQDAERFYDKMGWTQVNLGRCIYGGDETILMWIVWKDLLDNLREERDENDT